MTKKYNVYGLKNGGIMLYKFFNLKREAIEYKKYLISNHKDGRWKDSYEVIKVTLNEE